MKSIAAAPYRIFCAVVAAYAVIGYAMGAATQNSARAAEMLRFFHLFIETPPGNDSVILLVILYHEWEREVETESLRLKAGMSS